MKSLRLTNRENLSKEEFFKNNSNLHDAVQNFYRDLSMIHGCDINITEDSLNNGEIEIDESIDMAVIKEVAFKNFLSCSEVKWS